MKDKKVLDDGAERPEKKGVSMLDAINETMKNIIVIRQAFNMQAILAKAKYDAYLSQGFSKEQALELCKEK